MSSRARSASSPASRRSASGVGVASLPTPADGTPATGRSTNAARGASGRQSGAAPRSSPRRPRGPPRGAGRRAAARRDRADRAGPSRHAASGTAPASDAAATSRSAVTANASGRSPFRSTSAPTRRPSPKTSAAGPSHGARNPATRRRERAGQRMAERPQRRRLRDERQERGLEAPAGRDEELERLVERQRVGPVGRQQRPGLEQPPAAPPGPPWASPARPRTCSRFVRIVLISPLCAIERNGWASRHSGWVFVA